MRAAGLLLAVLVSGCAVTKDIAATIPNPLTDNWDFQETKLADNLYRFDLRLKRYHTGGAGEARQIVHARAEQLGLEQGSGDYQLLEFTEGVASPSLGAQRVVMAKVRLIRENGVADSFRMNGR